MRILTKRYSNKYHGILMTLGQVLEAFTLPHYAEKYPMLPSKKVLEQFLEYRNGMVFIKDEPELLPVPEMGEGAYYLSDEQFTVEWAKVMFQCRNNHLVRKYDKKTLTTQLVVGYHPRQNVAYQGKRERIVEMLTGHHAPKYIRQHLVTKEMLEERFIFDKFMKSAPDDYMTAATHAIKVKETGELYTKRRCIQGVYLTPENIYKVMNGLRLREIKARSK